MAETKAPLSGTISFEPNSTQGAYSLNSVAEIRKRIEALRGEADSPVESELMEICLMLAAELNALAFREIGR